MTKEELLQLLKKGEASLLNEEGKDVSKDLENPEEKEVALGEKLTKNSLAALSKILKEKE